MRPIGRPARMVAIGLVIAGGAAAVAAAPAAASVSVEAPVLAPTGAPLLAPTAPRSELNVPKAACGIAGVINKAIGIACGVATNGGALLRGGKQLLTGNVGGAVSTVLGAGGGAAATASTGLGVLAIGAWVLGGAGAVVHEATSALGAITTPQLHSTWFSATYWRMAAIAAMLTLPFLFAATVQALVRSDAMLLARAALGYLPLAILAIAIAAPLTTLLLSASDELCGLISSAAGDAAPHLLGRIGLVVGGLSVIGRSPFLAFLVGLFMIGAAFALWIELLLREAAVYVVVLMLPLAFAALAWPARRIWAIRAVEVLVALILSKFAIVAVLSLGGAAVSAGTGHLTGISEVMIGTVLIALAAVSPWALLRLVPLAEVASAAMGSLRGDMRSARASAETGTGLAQAAAEWAMSTPAAMKREAEMGMGGGGEPLRPPPSGRAAEEVDEPPAEDPGPEEKDDAAPSPPRERAWAEEPILELGPNFGETAVWPHPDAE